MSLPTSIASQQHEHDHCIESAMATAKSICADKGAKLTKLRADVLRLIWQSHKPLGAYTLMEMLSEESTRRVAPPTVYRAVDFLLEQGLIHRIHSLNAYVGCTHPESTHNNCFMICTECGVAIELPSDTVNRSVSTMAKQYDFNVSQQSLEIEGTCAQCQSTRRQK